MSMSSGPGPLRVALRAPYFHSGQVWSLKQAVGVMGAAQLETKLTDKEEECDRCLPADLNRQTASDRVPHAAGPGPRSAGAPAGEIGSEGGYLGDGPLMISDLAVGRSAAARATHRYPEPGDPTSRRR